MKEGARILMLEDDIDDRFLTQETLDEFGLTLPVEFLTSSEELYRELEKPQKPLMILVDYQAGPDNAPKILKILKSKPELKSIPVIVLGENSIDSLVDECYALGANAFIIKPASLEETKKKIGIFFKYWMEVVELVTKQNAGVQ
jgi:two-component system response regulator